LERYWPEERGGVRGETCVTGIVLSILTYCEHDDDRLDTIAELLLEQQMPGGRWNCRRLQGATHASVHTTISVIEGLRLYELHRRRKLRAVRVAQERGREFLLGQSQFIDFGTLFLPRRAVSTHRFAEYVEL
jgi:hypothetical protein